MQNLTGGVLLLRNKFLIIFYRGKDFLPQGVANLVVEREMALRRCQLIEEGARVKVAETFQVADEPLAKISTIGTLSEFQDIQTKFGDMEKENNELEIQLEAQKENLERELRNQERKLSIVRSLSIFIFFSSCFQSLKLLFHFHFFKPVTFMLNNILYHLECCLLTQSYFTCSLTQR